MRIKITKNGTLMMERNGHLMVMTCPINDNNNCGIWCPLFQIELIYEPGNMNSTDERLVCTELQLCHNKKIEVDDIEYEK